MRKFLLFLSAALIAIQYRAAYAEQDCATLASALRSTSEAGLTEYSSRRVILELLYLETSSYTELSTFAAGVGVSAPVLDSLLPKSFNGNARSNNSTWKTYTKDYREAIERNSVDFLTSFQTASFVPADFADVLKECLNRPGIHFWTDNDSSSSNVVALTVKFTGIDPNFTTKFGTIPIIVTPPDTWKCQSSGISGGGELGSAEKTAICSRTSTNSDAIVLVSTQSGDSHANLPKRVECNETIVAKMETCPSNLVGVRVEKLLQCPGGRPGLSQVVTSREYCVHAGCAATSDVVKAFYQIFLQRNPDDFEITVASSELEREQHPVSVRTLIHRTIADGRFAEVWFKPNKSAISDLYTLLLGSGSASQAKIDNTEKNIKLSCGGTLCKDGFSKAASDLVLSKEYLGKWGSLIVPYNESKGQVWVQYCGVNSYCMEDWKRCIP